MTQDGYLETSDIQPSETWREVDSFTGAMKTEMRNNAKKGRGYLQADIKDLLSHLKDEVRELEEAITLGYSPETVLSEAADTANMAMMVSEKYRYDYTSTKANVS
jgi:gas vesicle protein